MRALRPKHAARAACAMGALLAGPAAAEPPTEPFSLADSLAQGRFTLELRPRYNRIEESNYPRTTEGGTLRAVGGWRSAPFHGWRVTLEAIHADHLGAKRFNDNGALFASSPYPLLPDPRYSGVNQAYVEYRAEDAMRVRAGRQVVRLDNQRWVSDNDFRQVPQVFDGVSAVYSAFERLELSAAHFARVRTTSGATNDLRLTLARAAWNPAPDHAVAPYGVFHDQAQNGASTGFADSSYRVLGVKAEGAWSTASIAIPYIVEYARQRPYAGGDARIDARYWRAGAGASASAWTARYDYEVKGSNEGRYGLQAPLTDFYAFNGWTLHFFNTPRVGLRDQWLTLKLAMARFTAYGETHRFRADFGGANLGREHDIGVTYSPAADWLVRLQHARYDPGAGTPDPTIRKTWLTLTFTH